MKEGIMGVTTKDIFGDVAMAPATPGSYAQSPAGHRLPAEAHVGAVAL
jgi:hypothetical protein